MGHAVSGELAEERGDRLVAPMIRGAHLRNYPHWVATHFTSTAADEILIGTGLDPTALAADGWYPLRSALEALDRIDRASEMAAMRRFVACSAKRPGIFRRRNG